MATSPDRESDQQDLPSGSELVSSEDTFVVEAKRIIELPTAKSFHIDDPNVSGTRGDGSVIVVNSADENVRILVAAYDWGEGQPHFATVRWIDKEKKTTGEAKIEEGRVSGSKLWQHYNSPHIDSFQILENLWDQSGGLEMGIGRGNRRLNQSEFGDMAIILQSVTSNSVNVADTTSAFKFLERTYRASPIQAPDLSRIFKPKGRRNIPHR